MAPGPPSRIDPQTPATFPVPSVAASEVDIAAKGETPLFACLSAKNGAASEAANRRSCIPRRRIVIHTPDNSNSSDTAKSMTVTPQCAILMRMEQTKRPEIKNGNRESTVVQLIRYAVVAFLGFAADYALLALLTQIFRIHHLVAVPIAFLIGLTVNYALGIVFVFHRGRISVPAELSVFLLISLAALGITELTVFLMTDVFGISVLLSKIASGILSFLWNFTARKLFLYQK